MKSRNMGLLLGLATLLLVFAPVTVFAKDADRDRFQGRVEELPVDRLGTWVIGGVQLTTDARTEYDQADGPLLLGSCAKVDIRGGRVHEIDSEPDSNCR